MARLTYPTVVSRLTGAWGRVRRRLRGAGWSGHLRGLWLRRHFQRAGVLVVFGGGPWPQIENRGGRIEVDNCAFFPGVRLECWPGAVIRIGNGTYLNRNTEIVAAQAVTIGRDCMIARDVIIMDTDQHPLPGRELVARPVVIGDRVWIGSRALILKGVTIGHHSVIGAGAIVTKSVPPGSVVVGQAARVIRTLTPDEWEGEVRAGTGAHATAPPAADRPASPNAPAGGFDNAHATASQPAIPDPARD